jgi:hypothetical protein
MIRLFRYRPLVDILLLLESLAEETEWEVSEYEQEDQVAGSGSHKGLQSI